MWFAKDNNSIFIKNIDKQNVNLIFTPENYQYLKKITKFPMTLNKLLFDETENDCLVLT